MPGISGLEAIESGKGTSPNTQWIILSGYSEFDYARRALNMQASGYLLKPVDPKELMELVNECGIRITLQRKKERGRFEQRLQALINNTASESDDDTFSGLHGFSSAVVIIESAGEKAVQVRENKFAAARIRSIFDKTGIPVHLALVNMPEGHLAFAASGRDREVVVRHIGEELLKDIRDRFSGIHHIVVCESEGTISDMLVKLESVPYVTPLVKTFLPEQIIELDVLIERSRENGADSLLSLLTILRALTFSGSSLFPSVFHRKLEQLKELCTRAESGVHYEFLQEICTNLSIYFTISPERFFSDLPELAEHYWNKAGTDTGGEGETVSELISKAETMARNRFSEAIGVAQVADELNVTPNYLSAQFKTEKGIGLNQFITELRFEKASALLISSSLNIKEVAEAVGYTGSRHFSRIFRERYGISPSDFLEKYRRS
jgi:two-component system response regulator YesN